MTLLEVALGCAAREWHVFPCWPRTKKPMTQHGWHDATLDPGKIEAWWTKTPDANVAIACNPSGLCVLDVDHGLAYAEPGFFEPPPGKLHPGVFEVHLGIPNDTYTVRTGRRPEVGMQYYFEGTIPDVGQWTAHGCEGQIKSAGGYVMAAGSIHPDSGEPYIAISRHAARPTPIPDSVRYVKPQKVNVADDEPITGNRNVALTSIAGKLRNAGLSAAALEVSLLQVNADRCQPPLDDGEVQRIAANASRWELPKADAVATIGKPTTAEPTEPIDWRSLFHSREETETISDPEFLIRDFLQAESITGIIGPARARKSIVTLNVIHSLLTGEPLFGRFEVPSKSERVVYLCPESGLKSLGRRIRNMGLTRFVGDTLFYTSMNSDPVSLTDAALRDAVRGSVLFIDTAIRFFDGDENSSQDMKLFGKQCQSLIRDGVCAVVLLHHTAKAAEGITLESGRGSGDFGGFLTCCWGTTLDDYEDAYNAHSLMSCVKQRDFQADSFKVSPSGNQDDFFLHYVEGSNNARVQVGAKAKAGKAKAMAFIRAHLDMTGEELAKALEETGIEYSVSTCRTMLREAKARQAGATTG